jgi:undecaprenyl diphosphate synthase
MNKLNHVAFIMDGNGRWGKNRNKSRNFGHLKGVDTVKLIVKSSIKFKIPIITFYVFSTENWNRPKSEVNFLFNLIKTYFKNEIKDVVKNGIKINILGNTKPLQKNIKIILKEAVKKTNKNKKILVNLALNYGSKNEIKNAFNKMLGKKVKFTNKNITKNLYTKNLPDPDILIRTGGKKRLSNFMLWQLAYAELYFIDKLWPDFNEKDLKKIIYNFKSIKRNFGGI